MDSFWIDKARKYIAEHNAFEDVSDVITGDNDQYGFGKDQPSWQIYQG